MSKLICLISEGRVRGVLLDTADAWAVNDSDVDIAIDTPERAPGVSHDVVGSVDAISAITNDNDGVVQFEAARVGVKDTAGVELEDKGISFECDRDWTCCHCCHQIGGIVLDNVGSVLRSSKYSFVIILAFLSLSCVDIFSFTIHAEIFGIIKSSIFISAIAALTSIVVAAVDELLLGERQERTTINLEARLHGAHCRESPARPTLALILHWVDSILLSPINACG
jgi:hypothetical protein